MQISIGKDGLKQYLRNQLDTFFPDGVSAVGDDIDEAFDIALERLEYCFKRITFPAYSDDKGNTFFSHLHADQYATFLYFFSNSLWNLSQNKPICDKVIYLNRVLNNFMFSYKGKLPKVFFFGHPVGSILGNADYGEYLVVFQNVTVNTSSDENGNVAPKIGKGLFLGAGAKIIGNKKIGDRVSVSLDTVVYGEEIPDDSVVITDKYGNTVITKRKKEKCMAQNYFREKL